MTRIIQARVRACVLFVSLLVALCAGVGSSVAQPSTASVTLRNVDANSQGQVAIVDPRGQRKLRLLGVRNPVTPFRTGDGRVLVFDLATREVLSIVETGSSVVLGRTWKLPLESADPVVLFSANADSLLVLDRRGRTFRFSGDTAITTGEPPPGVTTIASGTVLSDGRLLVLRSEATELSQGLFVIRPEDLVWSPMAVTGDVPPGFPAPTGVVASGATVYLWRGGHASILRGSYAGDSLTLKDPLTYPGPSLVVPTTSSDLFVVTFSGFVARLSESGGVLSEYQFINLPEGALFNPKDGSLWLFHQYPQAKEWPAWRNNLLHQQATPFNWKVFWPIVGSAFGLALVWGVCAVRWGYEPAPVQQRFVQPKTLSLRWSAVGAAVALVVIAGGGLFLAWGAQEKLLIGLGKETWLMPYLIGAILVGIVCEVWRRWHPNHDEPLRFTVALKEPAPSLGLAFLVPLIAISVLSWMLYSLGIDKQYNNGYREALFCAGLVFVAGVLVVDGWVCRAHLWSWLRAEWLFLLPPLVVGAFTLFYRLEDIPYNTHFDFTTHAFVAEQFLRGISNGWWDWGFVPAPVIGSFPEMLGFLIAGYSPLGYRFGSALFNLSAIFAVYLLGREYRNPRVGFWAAIVLAGNAPFIHFGRLMSNGSAATLALWAVVTLALALRYKRSSLWLLAGLVAALTFYQWPVARVGAVAAALMYALVWLRFPIRQLEQVQHHIFGLAAVGLLLAPLIVMWTVYPERLMPRAQESLTGLQVNLSSLSVSVKESTTQLFFQSLGWIFNEYDRSSQGSISPGFNSIEAVLFACGLAILFLEGFSLNVLLGLMLLVTLLVCGAWAVGPPWYTRVLPTAPIASLLIARSLEGLHNFSGIGKRKVFWGMFCILSAGLLFVSPWSNFKKYYDYETAAVRRSNLYPQVAIGRAIDKTGPKYTYVLALFGEPSWRFSDSPIGHLLPYISERKLKESYDIREELPVKRSESKAFIVQVKRVDLDVPVIKEFHPDATVSTIEDLNHDIVAYMVLVDR